MLLKGKFIELGHAPEQLKEKYSHRLVKLWTDLKLLADPTAPRLDPFDPLISRLQAWEEVRYPSYPAGASAIMAGAIRKDHVTKTSGTAAKGALAFQINLEAMDELLAVVVAASPLGCQYIRGWLGVHRSALDMYERENQHPIPLVDTLPGAAPDPSSGPGQPH
jgi:hypothetical protein